MSGSIEVRDDGTTVAYLTDNFELTTPEKAQLVKFTSEDGTVVWGRPAEMKKFVGAIGATYEEKDPDGNLKKDNLAISTDAPRQMADETEDKEKSHDAGVQPEAHDLKPKYPATIVTSGMAVLRAEWNEADHPRDEAGKFTDAGSAKAFSDLSPANQVATKEHFVESFAATQNGNPAYGSQRYDRDFLRRVGGDTWDGMSDDDRLAHAKTMPDYAFPKTSANAKPDDTASWTNERSEADKKTAALLETQRHEAIANVERLIPGATGQDESGKQLTGPNDVKTWANMPEEWKTHAQNRFIDNFIEGNMPAQVEWTAPDAKWEQVPQEARDSAKIYFMGDASPNDTARIAELNDDWNNKVSDEDKLRYAQEDRHMMMGRERQRLSSEAVDHWEEMPEEGRLHFAQNETDASSYPELAVEEHDPDAEEDDPQPMSVDDFGEWDSLPSDWQEKTQEKWMEDSYSEFEQSEKESYEPDKDYATEVVSENKQRINDMIAEIPDEEFIYPGSDEDHSESEAKRREAEWQSNFDLKASIENGAFDWDNDGDLTTDTQKLVFRKNPHFDESQQLMPGIDRGEMIDAYNKSEWAKVEDDYKKAFEKKFEKEVEKEMESQAENYEPDSDSIKDYMNDYWENMTEKEKYKHAQNYLSDETTEGDKESSPSTGGPVREPKTYSLFNSDEHGSENYAMTGRLGRALALSRAQQIASERGVKAAQGMESLSKELWEGWKGSSTNSAGKLLQVATADELGGHLQPWLAAEADTYRNKGDYGAAKAYVRGLWETTQFLMHKAGKTDLDVYRGIMVDGDALANEPVERMSTPSKTLERVNEMNLNRNGAASWSTKLSVANNWGGIGHNKPKNPKRVVLRARVPATAVLALPAYGRNYHEEEEVVLAGTPYKKWDAWKDKAPNIAPEGTTAGVTFKARKGYYSA